jgi:hypothetical protein
LQTASASRQRAGERDLKRKLPPLQARDGYVAINAVGDDAAALKAQLVAKGMINAAVYEHAVSGRVPVSALRDIGATSGLKVLRPTLAATRRGLTTTQGDRSLRSDRARAQFGVDGRGVFRNSGRPGLFDGAVRHDFDPSKNIDDLQQITAESFTITEVAMNWDEPSISANGKRGSRSDVDLIFDNADGGVVRGRRADSVRAARTAVAALMLDKRSRDIAARKHFIGPRNLSPQLIYAAMRLTADDMRLRNFGGEIGPQPVAGAAGFDFDTGFGFLDAQKTLRLISGF